MKPKILKLSTVVLLLLFIGTSCQKNELEYADESIVLSTYPYLSVYKTKGNYINYIALQLTDDDSLNAVPGLIPGDPRITTDPSGNYTQNFRWQLKSGYVVVRDGSFRDIFTDITIREYVNYNIKNNTGCWPHELIRPRIIDKDPYVEYYHFNGKNKPEQDFTIGEINAMIENGTIEELFTRFK